MNMTNELIPTTKITVFRNKEIRKTIHNNQWWFVIRDVVVALTDSVEPKGYIKYMRRRDRELLKGWRQIARALPIKTAGGIQKPNCANTEGIFRIIQSIPSRKAEPFKLWLAKIGFERVQEIKDPELATKRTLALYKAKGYSDDWIEKRMRGIVMREELTDERKNHDVKDEKESEILTPEISKAAFGLTPTQYKRPKWLKRENLRDMTDLELIFSMLGEASTKQITKVGRPEGLNENKSVTRRGENVAGVARKKTRTRNSSKSD
jgi:DNA-damage-inducible protein D